MLCESLNLAKVWNLRKVKSLRGGRGHVIKAGSQSARLARRPRLSKRNVLWLPVPDTNGECRPTLLNTT